jgi:hypothetical protein
MVGMSGGPNGHWVRTSNPQNAKLFVQEQERKAAGIRESRRRSRAFRRRMWGRVRALFRAGRGE